MNGKELFEKVYDDKISKEDCIKVIHPEENNHYLTRDVYGNFDTKELIRCLLFKEYTFDIVNQNKVINDLKEKARLEEIAQLEARLKQLKQLDDFQGAEDVK